MPLEAMLAEHPNADADHDLRLTRAVRQAVDCAAVCTACADACLAEPMDMRECIRLNLDCADVCHATARVASRRTGHDRQLIRSILAVCIEACQRCASECARYEHAHCRRCAQACLDCAEDCLTALGTINAEVRAQA
ncbi:MAG TPA: four-helix bundle copper-binding protein [Novosphingobium sp.]